MGNQEEGGGEEEWLDPQNHYNMPMDNGRCFRDAMGGGIGGGGPVQYTWLPITWAEMVENKGEFKVNQLAGNVQL